MSHAGDGYGSEYHLLRFLGRHRSYLDERVLDRTGASRVSWLDVPFERREYGPDAPLRGLEFLEDTQLRAQHREFWPGNGAGLAWDAARPHLSVDGMSPAGPGTLRSTTSPTSAPGPKRAPRAR